MDCCLELLEYEHDILRYLGEELSARQISQRRTLPGGDDFKLKGWDIRTDLRDPMFVNKRFALISLTSTPRPMCFFSFDAGITTIQSHPYIEHLLAVGRQANTNVFLHHFTHTQSIVTILQSNSSTCETPFSHYHKLKSAAEHGELNGTLLLQENLISSLHVCTTDSRFCDSMNWQ